MNPYKHQLQGTEALIKWDDPAKGRIYGGCFGLFDEMGLGKTKQVIDAAQSLYSNGEITKVIIVAPVAVRSVWFDPELGELRKHLNIYSRIIEYHNKIRSWDMSKKEIGLIWMITNYDYIRGRKDEEGQRLEPLLDACDKKTLFVIDESSAVKSWSTLQTQACLKLRRRCGRITLLNGTPIAHSPNDMYSQGLLLDSRILNCRSYYHFRAKYAVMGGYRKKQIRTWVNLEDLQRRFAPYVIRRLKADCLDLPEKLPTVILTVTLDKESWRVYTQMRDEMIAWLKGNPSLASQAVVKALRLAQITSGFLGGIEEGEYTQEVGREKLDFSLNWLHNKLNEDPNLKLLVWCRFRAELRRFYEALEELNNVRLLKGIIEISIGKIAGGQKSEERDKALRLLDPRTMPAGPAVVIGSPQAGGMGLNLTGSHTVFRMSSDYNMKTKLHSDDRVHRLGQIHAVSYFDVMAVGPDGQKTIDHSILKALRKRESLANWTTRAWLKELEE